MINIWLRQAGRLVHILDKANIKLIYLRKAIIVFHAQCLYKEFYTQCFWHLKKDLKITENHVELVAKGLMTYGGREGYKLGRHLLDRYNLLWRKNENG